MIPSPTRLARRATIEGAPRRILRLAAFHVVRTGTAARRLAAGGLRPALAGLADSTLAAVSAERRSAVWIDAVEVSGDSDLSLRVSGKPSLLHAVNGLGLTQTDSHGRSHLVDITGGLRREQDRVWVVGQVPLSSVPADGSARLQLLDARGGVVPHVVRSRSDLVHHWSRAHFVAHRWPARVVLDPRHQRLSVLGAPTTRPAPFDLEHRGDQLMIRWQDHGTLDSSVRLVETGSGRVVIIDGKRSSDGSHEVGLALIDLASDRGWRVEVLTADGAPARLRLRRGAHPPLTRTRPFRTFWLRGDPSIGVQVSYVDDALTVSVRQRSIGGR